MNRNPHGIIDRHDDHISRALNETRNAYLTGMSDALDDRFDRLAGMTIAKLFKELDARKDELTGSRRQLHLALGAIKYGDLDKLRRLQADVEDIARIDIQPGIHAELVSFAVSVTYLDAHCKRSIPWQNIIAQMSMMPRQEAVIGLPFDVAAPQIGNSVRLTVQEALDGLALETLRAFFDKHPENATNVVIDELLNNPDTYATLSVHQRVNRILDELKKTRDVRLELVEKRDSENGERMSIVAELFISSEPETFTVSIERA